MFTFLVVLYIIGCIAAGGRTAKQTRAKEQADREENTGGTPGE